jgi:uncharacterized protein with FMN-binding domain
MRKPITAALGAVTIALPTAGAAAAAKTQAATVTKTVSGPQAQADRWGYVEVTLVVKKTTTVVNGHKKVTRKIVNAKVPVYPNHTDRSIFISQQAIPYLLQEVMQAQFNPNINLVGGATATSYAFSQSLQAALLQASKI